MSDRKTGKQGFASMPEEKRIEIAKKGGKASHERGTAHEFTSAEAKRAGKKGGKSKKSL
jgi:general stress protein YciG